MLAYLTNQLINQTPLLNDWIEHYGQNSGEPTKKTKLPNTPQSFESNTWLYDCTFQGLTDRAIDFSSSSSSNKLLVEYSSFNTCSSSGDGGAIYFGTSGQCVLSSVCGVKCNTGNSQWGQFCYVWVSSGETNKNHIIDSSVTLTKQTNARSTLYHWNGDVSCKGVNVSNNQVYCFSGIYILNPSISSISFSSFRNNKASNYICLDFVSNTHQMTNTNIIENNQQSTSYGIIYASKSEVTMIHCSVFGNCETGSGSVFSVSSGSITCSNCSFGPNQQTKSEEEGTIDFGTPSEPFINYYEFLELDECKRGLDAWSDIPILIPSKSPQTQGLYPIIPKMKRKFFLI